MKIIMKENIYYYISGNKGMTSSGNFTGNKNRWIVFDRFDKERMEKGNIKPYGATKRGMFIHTDKF